MPDAQVLSRPETQPAPRNQESASTARVPSAAPINGRLDPPEQIDRTHILWGYAAAFIVFHAACLLVFVPWFFSWAGVVSFAVGVFIFGQIGVPIGYHRLLAHRSFKAPKWFERTLATLAMFNAQETPARWVSWHRMHHKHSDHQEDPHSPLVTFGWGHVNWLVYENRKTNNFSCYQKYARDILEDPYYMWLEKIPYPMAWFFIGHAVAFYVVSLAICAAIYGPTMEALQLAMSLFVWGVVARTVYVWHITWSVNSLSHLFGYRNYETTDSSRNNWFVALITGGEGWHNNHHHDQASASVQHRWWEFDPSYYVIKLFELVGLAKDVTPPRHVRQRERAATVK